MKTFDVSLGQIPVDASDTDEALRKKAEAHLPEALRRMGRKAGEEAWATMQRELRASAFKMSSSSSDREKFIRESAAEFEHNASAADRARVLQTIFDQIQQQRDAKA
jgi:hypothetical protein